MRTVMRYIAPLLLLFFLIGFTSSQIQTSDSINLEFDGFQLNIQSGLILGNLTLTNKTFAVNNSELFENSTTNYNIDLEHYNESLTEVVRLDYRNYSTDSKIVWNTSKILESGESLFVRDETGQLVYNRTTSHEEEIKLRPESDNSTFRFYVSSGEVKAEWNYTEEVEGFKLYRNTTGNPSPGLKSGNWTTVANQNFQNYLSNSSGEYRFEALDFVQENMEYCYRLTAYNFAGKESEPTPTDPEGQCVST